MSINLSNFRDETVISLSVEGQLNKDSLEFNGRRIRFTEPIKYDGEIYKVGKEKYLHVNINYRYEEVCGRCLEAFSREDKTVLSGKLVEKENEIGLDEDEDLIYYYDERLELAEYVVDAIIVSLPMKPLCHEGCKGLCAKCGANRNKDDCQCVVEDIDPRFAILRDLFPRE